MGMCAEEMERWGLASIFKESARLLRNHYRLLLPFFLVFFYLPDSIVVVFQTWALSSSSTPLLADSIVEGSVNTAQNIDPPLGPILAAFFWWILLPFLLISVLKTLGTGAFFYVINYLYTPTCTGDDRSVVHEVFKFLPGAFLRMFITQLWIDLALFLLCLVSLALGGILYAITSAAAGWSDLTSLFFFFFFLCLFFFFFFVCLFFAATIYLGTVFALAQAIAVLEPGNYGRGALKRSKKLVRIGRVRTIVAVTLTGIALSAVLSLPNHWIMTAGTPWWAKVVLEVVIEGVRSVFEVYLAVVSVVMYFVYKARFAAAARSAGIPVLKQIELADHPYDPIVEGEGSVTFIGGP